MLCHSKKALYSKGLNSSVQQKYRKRKKKSMQALRMRELREGKKAKWRTDGRWERELSLSTYWEYHLYKKLNVYGWILQYFISFNKPFNVLCLSLWLFPWLLVIARTFLEKIRIEQKWDLDSFQDVIINKSIF